MNASANSLLISITNLVTKNWFKKVFFGVRRAYSDYSYEADDIEEIYKECVIFINSVRHADALETCMCFDSDCDLLMELVNLLPGIISSLKNVQKWSRRPPDRR